MNKPNKKFPFLDLTNDRVFKTFFSKNKTLLLSLLKAFLPLPDTKSVHSFEFIKDKEDKPKELNDLVKKRTTLKDHDIKQSDVILTDTSLYAPSVKDKQVVLDLNVQLNTGEKIDVEMQSISKKAFVERTLFYWSRLFTKGLKIADPYSELSHTYSVIFTKSPLFGTYRRNFITSFSIRSDHSPYFKLSDYLQMIFVELSRFQLKDKEPLLDLKSQWCYLLKESRQLTLRKAERLSKKGGDMAEALKFLYELSSDHRRQAEQEALEKHERDQIAIKEFAFDEGFEKGVKTGIEQGIEQGIKQTALKMLKSGLELSTIVKITNLSEAQIKKLKLNKPLKK